MKLISSFVFLLMVFSQTGFTQEKTYTLKGQVHSYGETLKGAAIKVYKGGDLIYKSTTRGGGRFEFELEAEREYMMEVSMENLRTKAIWINTKGTRDLTAKVPAFAFDVYLKKEKITRYDELSEIPVTLIKYQAQKGVFYIDKTYEDAVENKKIRIEENTIPVR